MKHASFKTLSRVLLICKLLGGDRETKDGVAESLDQAEVDNKIGINNFFVMEYEFIHWKHMLGYGFRENGDKVSDVVEIVLAGSMGFVCFWFTCIHILSKVF